VDAVSPIEQMPSPHRGLQSRAHVDTDSNGEQLPSPQMEQSKGHVVTFSFDEHLRSPHCAQSCGHQDASSPKPQTPSAQYPQS
jgi:hypothetical protein